MFIYIFKYKELDLHLAEISSPSYSNLSKSEQTMFYLLEFFSITQTPSTFPLCTSVTYPENNLLW